LDASPIKAAPQALKVKPPVKKPGVESAILKPVLRLIDEAETAAEAKDMTAVLKILGRLRRHLAEY
jgi:hypothetical protein